MFCEIADEIGCPTKISNLLYIASYIVHVGFSCGVAWLALKLNVVQYDTELHSGLWINMEERLLVLR